MMKSSLSVLVILTVSFLVSLSLAAIAAPPIATGSCAYNAGATETGLEYLDPLCDRDPGHHPSYAEWMDYPNVTTLAPCPPPMTRDVNCLVNEQNQYYDEIEFIDTQYREAVCACWEQFPEDIERRDRCLLDASLAAIDAAKLAQGEYVDSAAWCCTFVP